MSAIAEAFKKAEREKAEEKGEEAARVLNGVVGLLQALGNVNVPQLTAEELAQQAETDKALRDAAQMMAGKMDSLEASLSKIYAEAEKLGLDLSDPGSKLGAKVEETQRTIDDLLASAKKAFGKDEFSAFEKRVEFSRLFNETRRTPLKKAAIFAQIKAVANKGRGKLGETERVLEANDGKYPDGAVIFYDMALLPIASKMPGANGHQSKADYQLFNALRSVISAFFKAEREEEERLMAEMRDPKRGNADLSFFLRRVLGKYLVAFKGNNSSGAAIVELELRRGEKEEYLVVYIVDGAGAFRFLRQMKGVYIPFGLLWNNNREERENRVDAAIPQNFNEAEAAAVQRLVYTIRVQTLSLREQYRKEKKGPRKVLAE